MQKRNPLVVILLTLITFGIYGIYWEFVTASEMRAKGADIPSSILIFVPFANYYWLYKYSLGVEQISGGKTSGTTTFLLWIFTGIGGLIVSQLALNEAADGGIAAPAYNNGGSPAFQQQAPVSPNPGVVSAAATPFAAAPATPTFEPQQPVMAPEPTTFAQAPVTEPTPVVAPTVEAPVAVAPTPDFGAPTPETIAPIQPPIVQPEQPAQPTTFEPQVITPTIPQEDPTNPPSQV